MIMNPGVLALQLLIFASPICIQETVVQSHPSKKSRTSIPSEVSKWLVFEPPVPGSEKWRVANHSSQEWQVIWQNGQVIANSYDENKLETIKLPFRFLPHQIGNTPRTIPRKTAVIEKKNAIRVSDGWLISSNAGEWGGSIYWYSPDGLHSRKVSKDQVEMFLQTKQTGLIAIQGLSHVGYSHGSIVQLAQNQKGIWLSQEYINLKQAPYTAAEEADGSLLVVTSTRLLRIHSDKTVQPLIENGFWAGLYPNSMVMTPNGDIYVGMRHGIARINATTENHYKVEWLLPNREFADRKDKVGPIMMGRPNSVGF